MIASLPVAVLLTAVFLGSGALALRGAPARAATGARPLVALAEPAMSVSMVAMTWARLGALASSWQAVLLTAIAGALALERRWFSAVPAAASVWMLVAMPGPVAAAALSAVLLGVAVRARRGGTHTLMCLGMAAMLVAQNA